MAELHTRSHTHTDTNRKENFAKSKMFYWSWKREGKNTSWPHQDQTTSPFIIQTMRYMFVEAFQMRIIHREFALRIIDSKLNMH